MSKTPGMSCAIIENAYLIFPMVLSWNTPGTTGGPGGRDRTLAVCIYLLVMPKYWVKNYFTHGRFPEGGQKQKTEKERKKEREILQGLRVAQAAVTERWP